MQQRAARDYAWRRPLAAHSGAGSLPVAPSSRTRAALIALTLAVLSALGLAHALRDATATPHPLSRATRSLDDLPIAARGPISRLLGASTPGYAIRGLHARNPAQQFGLSFTSQGASIDTGRAQLGLSLAAYGSTGSLRNLAPAQPQVSRNTVSYAYGPVREWFANGPAGLEQGFDLASAPPGSSGSLTFLLRASGNFSVRQSAGSIDLSSGREHLRYGQLVVTDAHGHRLPAALALSHGHIAIQIDARGARYPLHVDPLLQEAVLRQPVETPDGGFGGAIAISGKTIAVGDDYTEDVTGTVYVFEEPSGGWAEAKGPVATLQASSHAKEEYFGDSVALSGDELVVGAFGRHDQGAAFVFKAPSPTTWSEATQVAELSGPSGNNLFGVSVAISGKTIAVGASGLSQNIGALFVFEEPAGGWESTSQFAAKLHGPNLHEVKGGEECPQLGDSIALAEHESKITVVGGAPGVYNSEAGALQCTKQLPGQLDVFTANVGEWTEGHEYAPTVTLEAPSSEAGNGLGEGVSLSEDGSILLAGAPDEMVYGYKKAGAAYVFTRPVGGWSPSLAPATSTLTSPKPFEEAMFGYGVALSASGARAVAGQPAFNPSARQNGHELVFERPLSGWASTNAPSEQLTANFEEGLNLDDRTIALEGETVVTEANGAVVLFGNTLGVEIESPANGATYTQGQTVTASYRCVPPPGEQITECNGPVASGAAIETSLQGVHSFTVTGKDSGGQSFTRTNVYLVTAAASGSSSSSEAVSKEGAQQTKTKAQIEAEEAARQAQIQQELKAFIAYVLYGFEHPASLGRCFNEGGFQENASVVPLSAWISAHGTTTGASSGGAAIASAGKRRKPREVTVFARTLEVKPGKVSFEVPFTKAGRALAKRDLAEHRPLKLKWTVEIRPAGRPTMTKLFTVTLKPSKASKRKHG